ncbi:hypothetical protein Tco_1132539 [Tanacetum coccineum]|uniref:Uncharacterized protein n=1 Tax=Tanacetum coccineum TaxID=301880 RepID=A0ABQ5JF78_9ASTR
MADVNALVEQAPVVAPPTRTDEHEESNSQLNDKGFVDSGMLKAQVWETLLHLSAISKTLLEEAVSMLARFTKEFLSPALLSTRSSLYCHANLEGASHFEDAFTQFCCQNAQMQIKMGPHVDCSLQGNGLLLINSRLIPSALSEVNYSVVREVSTLLFLKSSVLTRRDGQFLTLKIGFLGAIL